MANNMDFVSLGEVMIQLNPLTPGPLRYVRYYEVHVAGSEANMLIDLAKFGYRTGLITKVGNDEFGKLVINFLRGEGIDISQIRVDPTAPTGIYFIQRHFPVPGKSTTFYYRHGSAASKMSPEDIDEEYVGRAKALILTGITPALSVSCRKAVLKAYSLAKRMGVDIILDTNIRMKLWKDKERARSFISKLLESKILFTNIEDLNIMFPGSDIISSAKLLSKKCEIVIVKMGEKGALAVKNEQIYRKEPFIVPMIEDVIGAGDAFNAAFLATYYKGLSVDEALTYANAAGALTVTVRGDVEALTSMKDLESFIESLKKPMLLR